jgi:hypothetical protein
MNWICTPYDIVCVEWLPVLCALVIGIAMLIIFIKIGRSR